jgi:hypothetical protein
MSKIMSLKNQQAFFIYERKQISAITYNFITQSNGKTTKSFRCGLWMLYIGAQLNINNLWGRRWSKQVQKQICNSMLF